MYRVIPERKQKRWAHPSICTTTPNRAERRAYHNDCRNDGRDQYKPGRHESRNAGLEYCPNPSTGWAQTPGSRLPRDGDRPSGTPAAAHAARQETPPVFAGALRLVESAPLWLHVVLVNILPITNAISIVTLIPIFPMVLLLAGLILTFRGRPPDQTFGKSQDCRAFRGA